MIAECDDALEGLLAATDTPVGEGMREGAALRGVCVTEVGDMICSIGLFSWTLMDSEGFVSVWHTQ